MIDCPGVVYGNNERGGNNELESVLKGVVRIDNLPEPWQYIQGVLDRIKPEYVKNTYGVQEWKNSEEFLEAFARSSGKLLKGGEADINTAARMVLNDWQRGKLPFFNAPPFEDGLPTHSRRSKTDEAVTVEQLFHKITVKPKFSEEDTKGPSKENSEEIATGVKDWDALYEKVEGEEVEEGEAEKILNIQNSKKRKQEQEEEEEEEEQDEEPVDSDFDGSDASEAGEAAETEEVEEPADEAEAEQPDEPGSTKLRFDPSQRHRMPVGIRAILEAQERQIRAEKGEDVGGATKPAVDGPVRSKKAKNRSKKKKKFENKKKKFGFIK